jgi:hypothetical protein
MIGLLGWSAKDVAANNVSENISMNGVLGDSPKNEKDSVSVSLRANPQKRGEFGLQELSRLTKVSVSNIRSVLHECV